jgi:dienelactone hydrolase
MRCFFVLLFFVLSNAASAQDLHQQLLDTARKLEAKRRDQFAGVKTKAELDALQKSLREKFLRLLDGLPESKGAPKATVTGTIDGGDYTVDKLILENAPGYFMTALLYKPKKINGKLPGVISPCGHSAVGKAASPYQTLHINLAKRGYVVLTYDPIGQAERSQFWDVDKKKSRFNLVCGEHCVLGNPLYLLGTSLAKYRIADGMRAIDYLVSLPEVDPERIGCVGNSGGGTLTAYISALDPRVKTAAICCYITTLPRRMGNRIQTDPDADPEQDIFGFVGEGIDHAGLVALRAPRPTLLGFAQFDFFPIEGARESLAEAKKLYEVAGAAECVQSVEAAQKHGLSLPLRKGVYNFFERWLAGRKTDSELDEIVVKPRPTNELLICKDGQVNITYQSKHLLNLALDEFDQKKKGVRKTLAEVLRLDTDDIMVTTQEIGAGTKYNKTLVILVNGNESPVWQNEKAFLKVLQDRGFAMVAVDPRGVGSRRPQLAIKGRDYADPLNGVGKTLVGMRVGDVRAAVQQARKGGWQRIVLVGRRDAAIVACMTAALERSVTHLAIEEMPLSYRYYFDEIGRPINAASIVPSLLRDYGDIEDVLASIAPRKTLSAAGRGKLSAAPPRALEINESRFSNSPDLLAKWLDR